jgi:DNA modification methylase
MHEPCWYAVKGTGNWTGDRKQTTVWEIDKPQKSETGHSTQKPVECMRRPMFNNSNKGDLIYDPFLGSGTTVIAAETEGRVCLGMELNPAYCDIIVKRWQDFTGRKATHAVTGEPFPCA